MLNNYSDEQHILLKIKRTVASKRRCNHPMCGVTRSLRRLSKEKRYHIVIKERFFIPANSVVCCYHTEVDSWQNVNAFINSDHYDFTEKFVEDMFDLLSNPPLASGASKESSILFE